MYTEITQHVPKERICFMTNNEETLKQECKRDFVACWTLAGNNSVSLELFLWLKVNYENLCSLQRWGNSDVETELLWSLDDDASYRAIYLEEAMWGNPLMPQIELLDESDECLNTSIMLAIINNPNCPKSIIEVMSTITEEDRDWVDEEFVEELRERAIELLATN